MRIKTPSVMINIAHIATSTHSLGPGERAVVWVQGCPLNCPGCLAIQWQRFEQNSIMSPEEVVDQLLSSPTITGLTFSGGEPMLQAEGLARVAQIAKVKKELDIICFTGYRYETLIDHPPAPGVSDLLDQVDVLIDGMFIQKQKSQFGLRGSDNQHFIHLTERLRDYPFETLPRRLEIRVKDGELIFIGIPPFDLDLALEPVLQFAGDK